MDVAEIELLGPEPKFLENRQQPQLLWLTEQAVVTGKQEASPQGPEDGMQP